MCVLYWPRCTEACEFLRITIYVKFIRRSFIWYSSALYDDTETVTLDAALGVLKLSHKYQMDEFRRRVIRWLQRSWPLNREIFNQRLQAETSSPISQMTQNSVKLINEDRDDEFCFVLSLSSLSFHRALTLSMSQGSPSSSSSSISDEETRLPAAILNGMETEILSFLWPEALRV